MKLKEQLAAMDGEQKIKVGAKDGVGYFYVGTVADMIENMSDYTARVRQIAVDAEYRAEISLRLAISEKHDPSDYCQREI